MFYHNLPAILWTNVLQAYGGRGLIDLAAGSGEGCKAAMTLRKPCLAFCLSESHVLNLWDHLVDWMLTSMKTQTNVFFSQPYKAFVEGSSGGHTAPTPTPVPKPTPKAKTDPKAKKSKKDKKKKRGRSSSSSESSSSD
jgi:hypothetical protein